MFAEEGAERNTRMVTFLGHISLVPTVYCRTSVPTPIGPGLNRTSRLTSKKLARSRSATHQRPLNVDPATRRLALVCIFVFLSAFRRIRLLPRKSAVPPREVGRVRAGEKGRRGPDARGLVRPPVQLSP